MNKFFQVISNIKHNGDVLEVGRILEGEFAEFKGLVESGALRVLEGAESLESAMKMAAEKPVVASPVVAAQANTWEAKPDAPVANGTDATGDQTADTTGDKVADGNVAADGAAAEADKVEPGAVGTGDVAPAGDNL